MLNKLVNQTKVAPSLCDSTAKLSITNAFNLFMDLAGEHADMLDVGAEKLRSEGKMWLAVKTLACFHRLPDMLEEITATTWPEPPEKIHGNRDYAIFSGDELLISGKTQWTILDTNTQKLDRMTGIYPEQLQPLEEKICPQPFCRIRDNFTEEPFATYKVCSTDLDLSQHMNNVSYIRAICSLFTAKQWEQMQVREMEILYKAPSYEGDILTFQQRNAEGNLQLRASLPDGTTVILAEIRARHGN